MGSPGSCWWGSECVQQGPTHLQDEGQHGDEGPGALGQQGEGTDAVHAQGVEPRRWHQPGQEKQIIKINKYK